MSPATFELNGSPWAREELLRDRDRAIALGRRALELGARASIVGKGPHGPWVVRVGTKSRTLRFAGHELHDVVEFGLERWAAGADDTGFVWRAGGDHLAHAQPEKRAVWTLCRRSATEERYVAEERSRCQECWRALDRDVKQVALAGGIRGSVRNVA